jgi:hypothetical protein
LQIGAYVNSDIHSVLEEQALQAPVVLQTGSAEYVFRHSMFEVQAAQAPVFLQIGYVGKAVSH